MPNALREKLDVRLGAVARAAVAAPPGIALCILATLGIIAALYVARAFFIPLLIGILGSYTLYPVVNWLTSHRLPRPLAAAVVIAVLGGGLIGVGLSLSGDVTALIEKLPDAARRLRQHVSPDSARSPTALQNVQEAARELEKAAATATGEKPAATAAGGKRAVPPVTIIQPAPTTWVREYMLTQSALLATVAAKTPLVFLLIYFLLASGPAFRRKLVRLAGPTLSKKKDVVAILDGIEMQIQRFMLAMLVSNVLVAIVTWLVFSALGLEHAGVWGIAAGVLHFIPYVGASLVAVASGVAGFLQFGSVVDGLQIGCAVAAIAGGIGMTFMTWLHSRVSRVNAAALFIALLFFGWMWGAWGLLLGAPLVAITKVVFDHVELLKPMGELLEH